MAGQHTVISLWTILLPAGEPAVVAGSEIEDAAGRVFRVEGAVADRPNHRPEFRAAAARLISDLQ